MHWSNREWLALGALTIFLLSAVPLCAQDTPVGPEGTQVATQQTPAAATNSDALRNAAQNPVASLISVPIQENFNFNIGPADRTQNVLNIQPVIPLSISKDWNLIVRWITPVIYQPLPVHAGIRPAHANNRRLWARRHEPIVFLSPEKKQNNLGHRADCRFAYGNQHDLPRTREIEPGTLRGCARSAAALDHWISCKQHLVCRRSFQYR